MNVDTDTQYAFTRPLAGHMFANYDGVLKIDGEVGNKKVYDPRSYLKKAEASMTERVIEACNDLHSSRPERLRQRREVYWGAWQIFHCSSRNSRSKLRVERVDGSKAMNDVTLASACVSCTTTWSMLATTGYCLAAATRAWMSFHCRRRTGCSCRRSRRT